MKFKQHISLFFAFFFLVSNTGFAFSIHYCGDAIASFSNQVLEDENCCKIADNKESCCKDKVFKIDKKTDTVIVKAPSFQYDFCFLNIEYQEVNYTSSANFNNNLNFTYYCDAHAPPLFKLYNQYIFYDQF